MNQAEQLPLFTFQCTIDTLGPLFNGRCPGCGNMEKIFDGGLCADCTQIKLRMTVKDGDTWHKRMTRELENPDD